MSDSLEHRLNNLAGDVRHLRGDMERVNESLEKVADALTTIAVQGEKVDGLRREVDDLRSEVKGLGDRIGDMEKDVSKNTDHRVWAWRLATLGAVGLVGFVWKKLAALI